jgi:hypothetical protein
MRPWGQNYDSTEMLQAVRVDGFRHNHTAGQNYAARVLAILAIEKDYALIVNKIADLFDEAAKRTSIGMALTHLSYLSKQDDVFNYGRDGLDCLTYHLSAHCCNDGIEALQKVLARFAEDETKPQEAPRSK